ncbi:MAG: nitroreductase family protein [Planctomycetota bacterium]
MTEPNPAAEAVAATIRARRTLKVLGDAEAPVSFSPEAAERHRAVVLDALRTAGWAPFHYARDIDGLAEPWRAHVLWHDACQRLAPRLGEWLPNMKPTNKVPAMLRACGAMVLATWLPQFRDLDRPATPAQVAVDDEHLAAASAMVQNLLLLLTAHGMGTYWSSGGPLGSHGFFNEIGVTPAERLIAAVFVEFPDTLDTPLTRLPGKHRDRRGDAWIREASLD